MISEGVSEGWPLISSQRYLDPKIVENKSRKFDVFIVRGLEIELRGRPYTVLLDGHHNLAAARRAGVPPTWRGPSRKTARILMSIGEKAFAAMLINNLTDCDWYYVDTGEVVPELLAKEQT